nr:hypothetical protein [Tanacetum cinerariifolium]
MDTRFLKEELTRIPIWVKLNDVPIQFFKRMTNDGFQMVSKRKKRKGKSTSTNGGQFVGSLVKQTIRYESKVTASAPKKEATNVGNASESSSMVKTTGTSSKKDNITMSNSYSALNDKEEDDVENVYDELANIFTKTGGSLSFTAAAG